MEQEFRTNLTSLAAAYEEATGVTPATVAKRALADNKFFARLASGAGFTVKTYDRLVEWFSDNWPDGLDWPVQAPRPAKSEAAAQ